MVAAFRDRYLDVLASIYLYNEYRGYTSLDRVLAAAQAHCPEDAGFIAAIASHRADERKHYLMFRRWFERRGTMPLATGRAFGHIDHFIQAMFGCPIEALDTDAVIADRHAFALLCRVIALTEQRGLWQVEKLLASPLVRADPVMVRIFNVVHRDEPSHFLPYLGWLERHGMARARWNERAADWLIHKRLILTSLPALFFDGGAARLAHWPDAGEAVRLPA
ncbi:MAG: ferritin-like domain-containing protein [Sphingomonadales bacterium]|nr:ferritin-like domain-containing protein [Sphingomonadales bacterium]